MKVLPLLKHALNKTCNAFSVRLQRSTPLYIVSHRQSVCLLGLNLVIIGRRFLVVPGHQAPATVAVSDAMSLRLLHLYAVPVASLLLQFSLKNCPAPRGCGKGPSGQRVRVVRARGGPRGQRVTRAAVAGCQLSPAAFRATPNAISRSSPLPLSP